MIKSLVLKRVGGGGGNEGGFWRITCLVIGSCGLWRAVGGGGNEGHSFPLSGTMGYKSTRHVHSRGAPRWFGVKQMPRKVRDEAGKLV